MLNPSQHELNNTLQAARVGNPLQATPGMLHAHLHKNSCVGTQTARCFHDHVLGIHHCCETLFSKPEQKVLLIRTASVSDNKSRSTNTIKPAGTHTSVYQVTFLRLHHHPSTLLSLDSRDESAGSVTDWTVLNILTRPQLAVTLSPDVNVGQKTPQLDDFNQQPSQSCLLLPLRANLLPSADLECLVVFPVLAAGFLLHMTSWPSALWDSTTILWGHEPKQSKKLLLCLKYTLFAQSNYLIFRFPLSLMCSAGALCTEAENPHRADSVSRNIYPTCFHE